MEVLLCTCDTIIYHVAEKNTSTEIQKEKFFSTMSFGEYSGAIGFNAGLICSFIEFTEAAVFILISRQRFPKRSCSAGKIMFIFDSGKNQ
jgi:hypothetical protein